MTLIVLNAAEGVLDILAGKEELECAERWQAPTRGTEILAPALESMLRTRSSTPAHIRRWACVRGPGSFTGIRLTLATVAAIRRITGAEVAGLDYMQALACTGQRLAPGLQGHIWTLTHARRDLVHCQVFARHESGIPQSLLAVDLCSPAQAAERMAASPPGTLVLGSGLLRNVAALQSSALLLLHESLPDARDLWLLARHADYALQDIEPFYVRPCDAVDNLAHIARKQGMDPDAAHAKLEALLMVTPGGGGEGTFL